MSTVALHVWNHRLAEAAEAILIRWPWLCVEQEGHELHLCTPSYVSATAIVTLRGATPSFCISSAAAPTGSIAEARASIKAVEALCDAMDLAAAHVHGIREVGG